MDDDLKLVHESVHLHYRQRVSDLEWELAQSLAREKVQAALLAKATDLLEKATTPES